LEETYNLKGLTPDQKRLKIFSSSWKRPII